jgi:hypothetical protein
MTNIYDIYATEYVSEASILDIEGTLSYGDDLMEIYDFINNNYHEIPYDKLIISKHKIDGKYQISTNVHVGVKNNKITTLVNDLFVWDTVKTFSCNNCKNLKSLEGAPKKVNSSFTCNYCDSLINLIGAPEEVNNFYCNHCKNLKSLEGAPKTCINFDCTFCDSLINLIGAPEYVDTEFNCSYCKNLSSFEGIKWKSVHHFSCKGTSIRLPASEIKKIVHSKYTTTDYRPNRTNKLTTNVNVWW